MIVQCVDNGAAGSGACTAIGFAQAQRPRRIDWRGIACRCGRAVIGGDIRAICDLGCACWNRRMHGDGERCATTRATCQRANCEGAGCPQWATRGATPARGARCGVEDAICRTRYVQHQARQDDIASILIAECVCDRSTGRHTCTVIAFGDTQIGGCSDGRGIAIGGAAPAPISDSDTIVDLAYTRSDGVVDRDGERRAAACATCQRTNRERTTRASGAAIGTAPPGAAARAAERRIGRNGFVQHHARQADIAGILILQRIHDRTAGSSRGAAIGFTQAECRGGGDWRSIVRRCARAAIGRDRCGIRDLRCGSRHRRVYRNGEMCRTAGSQGKRAHREGTGGPSRAAVGATPTRAARRSIKCAVGWHRFIESHAG